MCGDALFKEDVTINGTLNATTNLNVGNISFTGVISTPVNVTAGLSANVGDVLIASTNDHEVVQSNVFGATTVVGVATSATTAISQTVNMAVGGEFQVNVTGPVNAGDFLVTSAQAPGVAISAQTNGSSAFAIATNSDSTAGTKTCICPFCCRRYFLIEFSGFSLKRSHVLMFHR